MTNFLDTNGLNQVLQSVDRRFAEEAKSVFKTDSTWEAASLLVLQGWISGNTATDPANSRTVNNFDVYLALDTNAQYYFDSGAWLPFTPDLTNYYTKGESDARYPIIGDFADINLAASPVVIPSKLAGHRQVLESFLSTPVYGLITAVQTTTVTVQFRIGSNVGNATLPYDGAIGMAKVGGMIRMERVWDRTEQSTTVTYTLNTASSRCYSQHNQQADWNVTDSTSPAFIKNKPTIPAGVEIVDHLNSSDTSKSLSANQGRVLNAKIEEIEQESDEPLSTASINSVLTAAGFPAIV
jgi:hypothetical protein